MRNLTLVLLACAGMLAVATAVGQYYVPRAYYTIDDRGHESLPVPLRRLRRSLHTRPLFTAAREPGSHATASANAHAASHGGDASASASARASGGDSEPGWYRGGGHSGHGHAGHGYGSVHPAAGYY